MLGARPPGGTSLLGGLVLLVLLAAAARIIYDLLAPLLPLVIALISVGVLVKALFRR